MSIAPAQPDHYAEPSSIPDVELRIIPKENIDPATLQLDLPASLLAGTQSEPLLSLPNQITGQTFSSGHFHGVIDDQSGEIAGCASLEITESPEATAAELYRELLSLMAQQPQSCRLFRVWNFVPQINEMVDGLENYQSFNKGRWTAFEDHFGANTLDRELPAASAVGVTGNHLGIAFRAGQQKVTFFENPLQLPAYQYPEEYGPRSPGFARGAVVENGVVYLSGTASIRGHKTIGVGDLRQQFDTTMANMRVMLGEMGVEENAALSDTCRLRVYLRRDDDLKKVRKWMTKSFGESIVEDQTTFLRADICREPLDIEMEGIFFL